MEGSLSYEFDSFRLVPEERQLLCEGQPVPLPPKAFDTLLTLVRNNRHALKKDDLLKQIWPDAFVEESNLNHNISIIRKALDSGKGGDGYVETVRGYGFRFNADVRASDHEQTFVHRRTTTRVVFKEEQTETQKTTTIIQTPASSRRMVIALGLISLILMVGIAAAYFGYIRPLRAQNARAASPGAPDVRSRKNENPAAREAYLKGRYFWNKRTSDYVLKAEYEFQNALAIDPNYAPAYAGLADCMLMGGAVPGAKTAKELALKALSMDPNLAEAHTSLAYYVGAVDGDWLGAEAEFQKSISLDPNYATARHWHAYNLSSLGRMDEALTEIKQAEALDPLSLIIKTDVGHMFYFARRYDEAIAQYLKALEINPDFRVAHWRLGEVYIQAHRYDEAISELQKALKLDSNQSSEIEVWLACAQAFAGHRDGALRILNRRKPDAELNHKTYYVALIYLSLGDKTSGLAWLEKSVERDGGPAEIKVEPMLDPLRNDSRFSELLLKMNLN